MKTNNVEDSVPARIEIYTDGACKGNPGPGGWGALLRCGSWQRTLYGGAAKTTSNRMELTAVIEALRALEQASRVAIYTDSRYVQKGITEWLPNWKRRGWKTSSGTPVKNRDLWQALDDLVSRHEVEWHWVRGHAGYAGNEEADRLANLGVRVVKSESA